jgi:hypothetical protein
LRGTIPAGMTRGVHLLAAYLPEHGIVLVEVAVDGKENEIIAAREVLSLIDVQGLGLEESIRVLLEGLSAKVIAGEGLPDIRAAAQELGFHHHGSGTFVQNAYFLPSLEEYRQPFVAAIAALARG